MRLDLGFFAARRPLRAPSLVAAPVVSAPALIEAGSELSADLGVWARGRSFARQWLRDGAPIPGATASTYAIAPGDVLSRIACRATAINPKGAASAESASTAVPARFDFRAGPVAETSIVRASSGLAQDLAGAWTSFAPDTARRTNRGLLAEPPLMLPATHRDPGLFPSGISTGVTTVFGCTRTVTAADVPGAPAGSGVRIQISGTPTGTGSVLFIGGPDLASVGTLHTAAVGQTWAAGSYRRVRKRDGIVVSSHALIFRDNVTGGAFLTAVVLPPLVANDTDEFMAITGEATDAATAAARIQIQFTVTAGEPVDVDVTFGAFNVHPGGEATSPIVSGTTRAKDGLTLTIPDGADGDTIAIATEGQPTRTLTRLQLFTATASRTALPFGAGDLPGVGDIQAGGLEAGYRQTVTVTPA